MVLGFTAPAQAFQTPVNKVLRAGGVSQHPHAVSGRHKDEHGKDNRDEHRGSFLDRYCTRPDTWQCAWHHLLRACQESKTPRRNTRRGSHASKFGGDSLNYGKRGGLGGAPPRHRGVGYPRRTSELQRRRGVPSLLTGGSPLIQPAQIARGPVRKTDALKSVVFCRLCRLLSSSFRRPTREIALFYRHFHASVAIPEKW
jgi:hypothetical protein